MRMAEKATSGATARCQRRTLAGLRGPLLLSLGSGTVFFALFESIVRLASPDLSLPQAEQHFRFTQGFEFDLPHHQRDAQLGWRLKPGTYGRMRVNRDGFRGADFKRQRAPATRRIAHLGDSCTMGFTIADDGEVYGARVAVLLSEQGVPTETLNFGVDGYSSHQGRLLIDRVMDYAPDYVTLYFGYNDHHYSNSSDRETRYSNPLYRRILEHSHAYRFMRRNVLRMAKREARLSEAHRRVDLDDFEENLRDMVSRVRERGATPILITTPLRPDVPLIQNEVLAEMDGSPAWITQDSWVSRELRKRGVRLEDAAGTQALEDVLTLGLRLHPEWSYLHFLRGRELKIAGRPAEARAALARAAQYDEERRVMERYADRVRRIAAELAVDLVDLADTFAAQRQLLFNDVVHPNRRGHRLIADELVQTVLSRESADADLGSR
jgi:lysophospholipase L1-like esterase